RAPSGRTTAATDRAGDADAGAAASIGAAGPPAAGRCPAISRARAATAHGGHAGSTAADGRGTRSATNAVYPSRSGTTPRAAGPCPGRATGCDGAARRDHGCAVAGTDARRGAARDTAGSASRYADRADGHGAASDP